MTFEWEEDDPEVIGRTIFGDGREIVVITAPASALDGADGPVVIPGADNESRITVVFAEEFATEFVMAGPGSVSLEVRRLFDLEDEDWPEAAVGLLLAQGIIVGCEWLGMSPDEFGAI